MSESLKQDWDPRSDSVLRDQRAAYDAMRERCPVAHSDYAGWSLFHHADVRRVLLDHVSFSNRVSRHVSVPNGMDPPEHTAYRKIIEPYFNAERMSEFEPICRAIAEDLATSVLHQDHIEVMADFAQPFALRIQCAFMGWPLNLQDPLLSWATRNARATLARDRAALEELAQEFDALIADLLRMRRQAGSEADDDVTTALMQEQIDGRPLSDQEIVSILRNWTVGEVGTIAASVGILAQFLAVHPEVQQQLRDNPELLWQANDEILRLHGPLVDNRRRTTCPVEFDGQYIDAGQAITINWIAANRDPAVFAQPERFSLDRDPSLNLLYGAGIHVCPGAPLARMELVIIMRSLLQHSRELSLVAGQSAVLATYPSSGYARLPLRLR
ncbi:cytochrome P450 [Halopseudomonas bauzanensis]|uniref:Cytochrome P450 n=1 Tax=Halopseudomonas bauzanensis TaxID=653930 RepID=A0A4U0YRM9_9GAMM|nr:cytochrome P450 [Halopseudomonas bauzanensis]TKA92976.1 cytochrome P450 [Halopseudomonas bauzanensis]